MNAPYDQDTEDRDSDVGFRILAWSLATVYLVAMWAALAVLLVALYDWTVG